MRYFFFFCLLLVSSVSVNAKSIYEIAGEAHKIDPLLLYAIATKESGNRACFDQMKPWPWALNVGGQTKCYASQAEVVAAFVEYYKAGRRNIDTLLMQVNLRWNGHLFESPLQMLDIASNVNGGALVLKDCLTRLRNVWKAVGCYHNPSDPKRSVAYANHVKEIYTRLKRGSVEYAYYAGPKQNVRITQRYTHVTKQTGS